MCLKTFMPKNEQAKIKNKIKAGGRKVYKVVGVRDGKYYPICQQIGTSYGEGEVNADTSASISMAFWADYNSGFHFFTNRKAAVHLFKEISRLYVRGQLGPVNFRGEYRIIECIVKKSWITTIGPDMLGDGGISIVAKKAIFPKFRVKK